MSKKHTILNQLLVTAAITSSSVLLTGCGVTPDSETNSTSGAPSHMANVARKDLKSDVASKDASLAKKAAIQAAAKVAELQPADPSKETEEQKAARKAAEDEAERLKLIAEAKIAAEAKAKKEEEDAKAAAKRSALNEKLKALGKGGPMGKLKEVFLSEGITYTPAGGFLVDINFTHVVKNMDVKNEADFVAAVDNIMTAIYTGPNTSKTDFKEGLIQAGEAKVRAGVEKFVRTVSGFVATEAGEADVGVHDVPAAALTEEQLTAAVANLRTQAIIDAAFADIDVAVPKNPMGGDILAGFLLTRSEAERQGLINAKSDADYQPFIDALAGNAPLAAAIPNDKRLQFAKTLQARAVAAALTPPTAAGLGLSAGIIRDLSGSHSLRTARTALTGQVDTRGLALNGVQGTQVDLGLPLFVQLKGSVDSGKSTDATTGSVAYRLGNTVIGALQAYANSGQGFGLEGRQLETSVVASHSVGNVFAEAQLGAVSANNVHNSDWSGFRSQFTVGYDAQFISPFLQVAHRQLDRNATYSLNDTAAYVGLDMEVAAFTTDTYRIDTRLLTKVGIGSKDWSHGVNAVGSTSGFEGSVEWSASLTLNSGVGFNTNLGLDTTAGSSAKFSVSVER